MIIIIKIKIIKHSVTYLVTLIIPAFTNSNMVKLLGLKFPERRRAGKILTKFNWPLLCKFLQADKESKYSLCMQPQSLLPTITCQCHLK